MKKLAIALPVNGRYELTRRAINSLLKHRDYWKKEVAIRIFLGTHEKFYFELASVHQWAIEAVEIENSPLGSKFNKLSDAAAQWGDYFIFLGSDDFLSPNYFLMATEAMELNKKWSAVSQAYVVNAVTLETRFVQVQNGFVGSGLLMKSDAWMQLREIYGDVYPAKNKSLDGQAFGRMKELFGNCWDMNSFRPMIACLKSLKDGNIWAFYMFDKFPAVNFDKLHDNFINSDLLSIENYSKILNSIENYSKILNQISNEQHHNNK